MNLPFMRGIRILDIRLDLDALDMLSFMMGSLRISLASPATLVRLEFYIWFRGVISLVNPDGEFYKFLRDLDAWHHLDSITTHPAASRLERVGIQFYYGFIEVHGELPDQDKVLKAILDGLPLLRKKGMLFAKATPRPDVIYI